jgi:hypothetical protein
MDEINDQLWGLIMNCCIPEWEDRPTVSEIQRLLENMEILDNRQEAQKLPGHEVRNLRLRPGIEWDSVKQLFSQIQVCQTNHQRNLT